MLAFLICQLATEAQPIILSFPNSLAGMCTLGVKGVSILSFVKAWSIYQGYKITPKNNSPICRSILLHATNIQLQEELSHSGRRKEGRKEGRKEEALSLTARSVKSTLANNEVADVTSRSTSHLKPRVSIDDTSLPQHQTSHVEHTSDQCVMS